MYRGAVPFHEDMIRVSDRLPTQDEYRRLRHLTIRRKSVNIGDDELAHVVEACPHLESVVLSGVPSTSDRTIVTLGENANNLMGIDLSGCQNVTDIGVLDIVTKSLPLQWVILNRIAGLTGGVAAGSFIGKC